ncbi:MAG TPA: HEAT repeat domain-containing protein [Longimicrobium sp.]|nr:HEAT repeat domain-containing protein [Longimicrobium sp.]
MPMNWLRGLRGRGQPPADPPPGGPITPPVDAGNAWWIELLTLLDGVGAADSVDAAAWTLWDRVQSMDGRGWVRADEMLRPRLWSNDWSRTLRWLGGEVDVRRLAVPAGTEAAVLGLVASHSSGFVREAAVQRLALVGGGDELPPLLLRANDWVPQVRNRAVDALCARVLPAYAGAWVRWLRLVLRLGGERRQDVRPLVDAVMALLRGDAAREAVLAGLHAPDRVVRRTCFSIVAEDPDASVRTEAVFCALGSDDVALRRVAVRAAGSLADARLRDLLPRMLHDSASSVRLAALRLAVERDAWGWVPQIRPRLLDRSAAVRAEARTALAAVEPMDFAAFYRGYVVAGAGHLAAAVAGLAETGGSEDAALVRPLVDDARPRVRAAAVRALARLGGAAAVSTLLRAVRDANPSVSRTAAVVLRDAVRGIGVDETSVLYRDSTSAHVRLNALSLLAVRGKWESISWILRALRDTDERVRRRAQAHLNRWKQRFNRVGSQPTPDQLRELRGALEQAADALDPRMRDWLRFAAGLPR